jgi:POT family proton-dependent oligopeptide transporter
VLHVTPDFLESACTQAVIAIAILYFAYLLLGAGLSVAERRRIRVVLVLFMASVLFWAGYEQAGSSLNLFAQRYTDRHLGGFEVPAAWLQSLDAIFIIAFGSLFSMLWVALARRRLDPSTGLKFVLPCLASHSASPSWPPPHGWSSADSGSVWDGSPPRSCCTPGRSCA